MQSADSNISFTIFEKNSEVEKVVSIGTPRKEYWSAFKHIFLFILDTEEMSFWDKNVINDEIWL